MNTAQGPSAQTSEGQLRNLVMTVADSPRFPGTDLSKAPPQQRDSIHPRVIDEILGSSDARGTIAAFRGVLGQLERDLGEGDLHGTAARESAAALAILDGTAARATSPLSEGLADLRARFSPILAEAARSPARAA